ncbi:MAG: hypothetical protein COA50_02085 [Flavobacteriaceae bacterium]|nr:MAG: hypothetical protein COA50_02085 [Flavobacteriaceae bacterium]
MYFFIAYLKFLWNSTNQHGVHSPFIYSYVTKCLYSKNQYATAKAINVLLKSIAYFKVKNALIPPKDENIMDEITTHFTNIHFDRSPFDILYFDTPNHVSLKMDNIHNDTMVIVNGIHHTSRNTAAWEGVKNNELVTITIDMFYCGVVFFRKEQVKQHFKIRI